MSVRVVRENLSGLLSGRERLAWLHETRERTTRTGSGYSAQSRDHSDQWAVYAEEGRIRVCGLRRRLARASLGRWGPDGRSLCDGLLGAVWLHGPKRCRSCFWMLGSHVATAPKTLRVGRDGAVGEGRGPSCGSERGPGAVGAGRRGTTASRIELSRHRASAGDWQDRRRQVAGAFGEANTACVAGSLDRSFDGRERRPGSSAPVVRPGLGACGIAPGRGADFRAWPTHSAGRCAVGRPAFGAKRDFRCGRRGLRRHRSGFLRASDDDVDDAVDGAAADQASGRAQGAGAAGTGPAAGAGPGAGGQDATAQAHPVGRFRESGGLRP